MKVNLGFTKDECIKMLESCRSSIRCRLWVLHKCDGVLPKGKLSMRQKMDPNGVDKPVIVHRNDTSLDCTPRALIDVIRRFMPEALRLCSYEEGLQCSNCKIIDQRDSNGKVLWRKELCKCQDINQHAQGFANNAINGPSNFGQALPTSMQCQDKPFPQGYQCTQNCKYWAGEISPTRKEREENPEQYSEETISQCELHSASFCGTSVLFKDYCRSECNNCAPPNPRDMVQAFVMNETKIDYSSGRIDHVESLYIGGYYLMPWRDIKQPAKLTLSDGQKFTAVVRKPSGTYGDTKIWFTPKVEQIKQLLPKMTPRYGDQLSAEVEYDDGSTKNVVVRIVGCIVSNVKKFFNEPCNIFPPPA